MKLLFIMLALYLLAIGIGCVVSSMCAKAGERYSAVMRKGRVPL